MSAKKVVVAMSGGVDSSVALAILKEQGYDCVGVSMQLWDYSRAEEASGATSGSCCSLDDIHDARRVADMLGVPFYVVNVEDVFTKEVVEYFVSSYMDGTTPNPCIKCNEVLKFEVLLKKALSIEADYLATGHYARIVEDNGSYKLLRGADAAKDQSYFLFTMTQAQLKRVLFPVGGLTKGEVRRYARALGLKTSDKEESQEICFVEEPRYADFLASRLKGYLSAEGDIVDTTGALLGRHKGIFNYTIGQRKGLSLSGGPYYVTEIDTASKRVVVGRADELYSTGLFAGGLNWIDPGAAERIADGIEATTQIRYRHAGVGSTVTAAGEGRVEVRFTEPQRAVTPGQAVVFYDNDVVLGGGWIESAVRQVKYG